jgi:hypothetical protein
VCPVQRESFCLNPPVHRAQFLSYSGGGGAFPFSFSGDSEPISTATELAFCGEQGEWHFEP